MAKRNTVAPDATAPVSNPALTDETTPANGVKWPNSRGRQLATVRAGAAFDAAKDFAAETAVDNSTEIASLQAEVADLTERRKILRERIEALSPSRSALWHERSLRLLEARLWRAGFQACADFVKFVEDNVGVTLSTADEGVRAVNAMLGNYCAFQRASKDRYAVSVGMILLATSIRRDLDSVKLSV